MEKEDQSCDVCIVCALPEETRAFLEVVEKQCDTTFQERMSPRYQYGYFATTITNHKGEFLHLHLSWLPRRGPQEMVRHLQQVVEEYQPRIVFMTGICAGDSRQVQLGDLVVAERVFTYDNGAYTRDEQGRIVHEHDILTYQPDSNLLRYLGMFTKWESLVGSLERPVSLLHQFNRNTVRCYIKPMASGSAVRADNPFKDIQAPVRDTVAIDLESQALGFVLSDRPHPIPWLVVKGVYNYANPETQEDNTYQDFAARASALYALSCIQNYVTVERVPLHPSVEEQAKFENFPRERNDFFTGRETVLRNLHETLNKKQGAILTYAISGMGGVGKTQTAIEYAYRYRDDYETVLWVESDSRETIYSGFRDIANNLRLPKIGRRTSLQKVMSAVRVWLESHQKWLLIFDNVDKPNEVLDLLRFSKPLKGGQHMLLTTRDKELSRQMNIERIEIDVMNEDEGSLFLLRKARIIASKASLNEAVESDRSVAREIVKLLGGLPLALDQAGAYIDSVGISLSKYLERYKEFQIDLLKYYKGKPPDYGWTVATTWGMSFSKIKEADPAAIELLRLLAFLDPDAIPVEMITKGMPIWGSELGLLSSNALRMDKVREVLLRFSLVQSNAQTEMLTIHRLVQVVIQDNLGKELRHTWAERAIRVVDHAFPREINKVETWEQCRHCQPHAEACAKLIKVYTFGFLASVQMLNQLAYYLREQASYKEAETYFQQALSICEQFGLEDYRDTIINNLARLYFDTYRYKEAASFYEKALAMREQRLGPDDKAIAGALNRLALTYWYEGNRGEKSKYTQAEVLYERALRISTQKLGVEHNDTLLILNNQALLYRSQGRYEEAIELNQRVLGIRRRKDPPVPLEVAQSLQNLAVTYYEQGDQSKYEEEERLLQEALAIREQRLSPKHLQIARCLRYLGVVYQAQKKYSETAPLFKRALDIFDEQLEKGMPETISLARDYHALLLKLLPESQEEIDGIETHYSEFNLKEDNRLQILECPPLEGKRIAHIYISIDKWLRSPALSALVKSFGSDIPSDLNTTDLGVWLLEFSEEWDYRKKQEQQGNGGARWEVDDSLIPEAQHHLAKESARVLGLIGQEIPSKKVYDFVWVLGGARLSCLLRPRLAARLVIEHRLSCGMIALLSSARQVADTEKVATDTYAPEAKTEFDLINRGAEIEFKLAAAFTEERYDDAVNPNGSWVIRTYNRQGNLPPLISLSAPSSRPYPLPANSADTYDFFFEHFPVPPGSSFLLITSQIYVPYQQLEAIRTIALKHNVVVETVGFPLEWSGELQGMLGASNYLQEIRSTIQSANRFFSMFPEG